METTVQEQPSEARSFPEAVLTKEQWGQVERACVSGMSYAEASRVFEVTQEAIRQRAFREKWLTPIKLENMRKQQAITQLSQEGVIPQKRAETAIEAVSTSLEGYRSRTLLQLAKAAENGVKRMAEADLPVESWQDAQIAANIAMKLHNVGQEGVNVNVLVGGDGGFDGPVIEVEGADYDESDADD